MTVPGLPLYNQAKQTAKLIKCTKQMKGARKMTLNDPVEAIIDNQYTSDSHLPRHSGKKSQGIMDVLKHVCANKSIVSMVLRLRDKLDSRIGSTGLDSMPRGEGVPDINPALWIHGGNHSCQSSESTSKVKDSDSTLVSNRVGNGCTVSQRFRVLLNEDAVEKPDRMAIESVVFLLIIVIWITATLKPYLIHEAIKLMQADLWAWFGEEPLERGKVLR